MLAVPAHRRCGLSLVLLVAVSCSGNGKATETPPALPTGFAPPPALGAPPQIAGEVPGSKYLAAVGKSLQPRWSGFLEDLRLRLPPGHPLNRSDLQTSLDLELSEHGALIDVKITTSSGRADFDAAALEVVRDAQPLPAPSSKLLSDDGHAYLRWRFSRDRRQAGPASAEIVLMRWPLSRIVPKLLAAGLIDEALLRVSESSEPVELRLEQVDVICLALIRAGLEKNVGRKVALAAAKRAASPSLVKDVAAVLEAGAAGGGMVLAVEAYAASGGDPQRLRALALAPDPVAARSAAKLLRALGQGDEVRDAAAEKLRSHGEVRLQALAVLAEIPAPELVKVIAAASRSRERPLRIAALAALGAVAGEGSGAALAALVRATQDGDARVRESACRALTKAAPGIRSRTGYWAAVALLRDRDRRVRGACAVAGAFQQPKRFTREMKRLRRDDSLPVELGLAQALAVVPGGEAFSRLAALARSERAEVRAVAATSLAKRTEPAALELREALAKDLDPRVRHAAIAASDSKIVLRLALADSESDNQGTALWRLTRVIGREAALPHVLEMLTSSGELEHRVVVAGAWVGAKERSAEKRAIVSE